MGQANPTAGADRINYLNIGLMLVSCAVALFIPFELFLFAYAVLGPAHYFTEISWLHKRGYFMRGKHDFLAAGRIGGAAFCVGGLVGTGTRPDAAAGQVATFTFLALFSALVLMLTDKVMPRILGLAAVAVLAFSALNSVGFLWCCWRRSCRRWFTFTCSRDFSSFTARSRNAAAAATWRSRVFLLCPWLACLIHPRRYSPSAYVTVSYFNEFCAVNMACWGLTCRIPRRGANAGLQNFLSAQRADRHALHRVCLHLPLPQLVFQNVHHPVA